MNTVLTSTSDLEEYGMNILHREDKQIAQTLRFQSVFKNTRGVWASHGDKY
jgi:hypothetical protein